MVDEAPPSRPADETSSAGMSSGASLPSYARLRWMIRITGVLIMLGGTIYLGIWAGSLLKGILIDHKGGEGLYIVVVALGVLGLAILALRAGLNMLLSVDSAAVGTFSFIFALIYAFIFMQILPAQSLQPILMLPLFLLSLGVTYFVVKRILLALLFPIEKDRG